MRMLFDEVHNLGVTIEFVTDLNPDHPGSYSNSRRHIEILDGMTYTKTRCAIAHELGHATLGHEHTIFEHINRRQERAADEWAAHYLINPDDYRDAAARFGGRVDWIAQELGVLKRIVIAYEGSLQRIGDTTYVRPRMGAGQAERIRA